MMIAPEGARKYVAYYDCKYAPVTFDFCQFIVAAAAHARWSEMDYFDLVIIADGIRQMTPREKATALAEREWRIWNLIVEIAKIVPMICNISVVRRAPEGLAPNRYPPLFDPPKNWDIPYNHEVVQRCFERGADVKVFRPSEYAMQAASNLMPRLDKPVVTMTIRKAAFDQERDSELGDWYEFSKVLSDRGFETVVIPDQDDSLRDRAIHELDWHVIDVASMSLDLRLALYNQADMNYVTNGGLTCVLGYSQAPFMWYKVVIEDSRVASEEYFARRGLERHGKYPWLNDNQEMIWENDTLDQLVTSIDRIKLDKRQP
jgi:hypothetical protein